MAELESSGEATSSSEQTPLSEVFGGTSETHVEHQSSASEKDESDDSKEEGDQKFPASESSSEKSDEKKEADEKQSQESKPDPKEKVPAKSDAEKKEEKSSDDKKADKWDTEENPFKKRFQDTAANWNKEHQEKLQLQQAVLQLQRESETLRKIADGTYDPEKDDPARQITPEGVASKALEVGKALASQHAAIKQFGAEKVNADLAEFDRLFGSNPTIQHLVLNSEAPVYEAFHFVERHRFESKYGSTPEDWHKNIRAEAEKELRALITKEVTESIMQKADKTKRTPTFSSSRGSNGLGKDAKPKSGGPTPLKDVFK